MRATRLLLAALALVAPAGSILAQPLSGRYQARPGSVLACIQAGCDVLQIDGSLDFELLSAPFPGPGNPLIRINGSHLRLRPVFGLFTTFLDGPTFPPESGPRLEDLVIEAQNDRWLLVEPPGAGEDVALELVPAGDANLLLRGTYAEACCDLFTFDLGGVIFDWTGPGPTPVLRLADRFEVAVTWQDFAGGAGSGTPVKLNHRAGQFWFFSSQNPELLVKVIDACAPFGRWWFFAGGLTNVGLEIRVTDQLLSVTKTYVNESGRPFQPVLDTGGFACLP